MYVFINITVCQKMLELKLQMIKMDRRVEAVYLLTALLAGT